MAGHFSTNSIASQPGGLAVDSVATAANIVPTARQTIFGLEPPANAASYQPDFYQNRKQAVAQSVAYHPRFAPSSVSTEQFLAARSLSSPVYKHNIAATKMAFVSDMMRDAPDFQDALDILA